MLIPRTAMRHAKHWTRKALLAAKLDVRVVDPKATAQRYGHDLDDATRQIVDQCLPYTMTSPSAIVSVVQSIAYVIQANVPGDIAECGVYRGGSMMAAALALVNLGQTDRDLWLYDTYEGFVDSATQQDGEVASRWIRDQHQHWDVKAFSLERVRQNILETGYPADRVHMIKGRVQDTLPTEVPQRLALLRLDTDTYESTRIELEYLYPHLSPRSVLYIDDYGCPTWPGSRRATDEYFQQINEKPLLFRVDAGARMTLKSAA